MGVFQLRCLTDENRSQGDCIMRKRGYPSVCRRQASLFEFFLFICLPALLLAPIGCRQEKESAENEPAAAFSQGPAVPKVPLVGNLLANPGFEEGAHGWFAPLSEHWVGFVVDSTNAHSGRSTARLTLSAEELSPRTQVWGVSQYVNPSEFPHKLSGWYLVNGWKRGAPHQYLQAVLMVWGRYPDRPFKNYQVRYILAGVDEQPYFMSNARYVFLSKSPPVEGEWIHFEANPAEDFQRLWKIVPEEYDKLQVFFEARFDDRTDALSEVAGNVFFDDVYLGQ